MKFVSHLDMTRVMSRLIKKSGIPVWYTEGFNRHIYMNFALPLSLGFESNCEIVDIKLEDDSVSNADTLNAMKAVCPPDIELYAVTDPIKHTKEIGFSVYELVFDEILENTKAAMENFFARESVLCLKTGKKGKTKEIDLIPKIKEHKIADNCLSLTLVAGSEDNLNPTLVMDTCFEQAGINPIYYTVTRTAVLDKAGENFR